MAIVDSDVTIKRASVVALVLYKGQRKCRSVREAREIVQCALTQGVPIEMGKALDGTPFVFVSRKGTIALRAEYGWKKPTRRGKKSKKVSLSDQVKPKGKEAQRVEKPLCSLFENIAAAK